VTVVVPVRSAVTSIVRSIALNVAAMIPASKPESIRMPLGGESTCTVAERPYCSTIADAASDTGCGGGGGGVTAGILGSKVGVGPGAVGDPLGVGLSVTAGDGVTIGAAVDVSFGDGSASARAGGSDPRTGACDTPAYNVMQSAPAAAQRMRRPIT
jgi:hypothetical protein